MKICQKRIEASQKNSGYCTIALGAMKRQKLRLKDQIVEVKARIAEDAKLPVSELSVVESTGSEVPVMNERQRDAA